MSEWRIIFIRAYHSESELNSDFRWEIIKSWNESGKRNSKERVYTKVIWKIELAGLVLIILVNQSFICFTNGCNFLSFWLSKFLNICKSRDEQPWSDSLVSTISNICQSCFSVLTPKRILLLVEYSKSKLSTNRREINNAKPVDTSAAGKSTQSVLVVCPFNLQSGCNSTRHRVAQWFSPLGGLEGFLEGFPKYTFLGLSPDILILWLWKSLVMHLKMSQR